MVVSLLLGFVIVLPSVALAQSGGSVTGVVKDAATNKPLKGATATLRDQADTAAGRLGDNSDDNGRFSIERAAFGRRYTLEVKYVGYEKFVRENITLTEAQPVVAVGEIVMQPGAATSEIEVVAERDAVTVHADKTVYAVDGNPAYTATTVSELLGQIPSVQVDQDGKISLRGNDNVTIMMNDRPLNMPQDQRDKFLQTLPANTVKDIEIRTNPGAQFDAKNQGGIINIVTRRTISDVIGGNLNGAVDSRAGLSAGAGLFYNGKTLNASLSGGLNTRTHEGSSNSLRLNFLDTNERRNEGFGTSESDSKSGYGFGQIDYHITENDVASLSFNLHGWGSDYSMFGRNTISNIRGAVVGSFVDTTMPIPGNNNSGGYNNASFLLKHTFSEGHTLGLDLSYNSFAYTSANLYSSTFFLANGETDSARSTRRNSISDQSNETIIASLDYEHPISDGLKLSFGARNERNILDNNTSVSDRDRSTGEFVPDTVQTNHYLPRNTIYALYANAAFLPIEEVSVQAGVRLEVANVSAKYVSGAEIISKDYSNIFPSGSLSWTFVPQHSVTLGYRRSIALPNVDALNPVRIKWNDLTEYAGNPDLRPEFTQSFELNYNTYWGMGNMVSVGPYYATTDGSIEQSQQLVNGVTVSTNENFNSSYSIGSEASISMRPLDWLNFRVSGNLFEKVNRGSDIPGDIYSTAAGYNASAMLNIDPMEGMTFSASLFANSPATVGSESQSGFIYMNCALRQRLFDKKLTVSLRVNDPLNLQKWENSYTSQEFHTESTSRWTSRTVALNINYTFGTTPRMEQHSQEKTETKGGGTSGGGAGGGGGQGGGQ